VQSVFQPHTGREGLVVPFLAVLALIACEDLRKFGKFYSEVTESVPRAFAPELAAAFKTYGILTPEEQPIVGGVSTTA
jgi:hypothetical protein